MAKDLFNSVVREILVADGWRVTHDPFDLRDYDPEWEIDFGAERMLAAERGVEKIAVEVKSFLSTSFAHEFHGALGQYLNYRSGLKRIEPNRQLFLAVPVEIFETEFGRIGIIHALEDYEVKILVFDPLLKQIRQWIR